MNADFIKLNRISQDVARVVDTFSQPSRSNFAVRILEASTAFFSSFFNQFTPVDSLSSEVAARAMVVAPFWRDIDTLKANLALLKAKMDGMNQGTAKNKVWQDFAVIQAKLQQKERDLLTQMQAYLKKQAPEAQLLAEINLLLQGEPTGDAVADEPAADPAPAPALPPRPTEAFRMAYGLGLEDEKEHKAVDTSHLRVRVIEDNEDVNPELDNLLDQPVSVNRPSVMAAFPPADLRLVMPANHYWVVEDADKGVSPPPYRVLWAPPSPVTPPTLANFVPPGEDAPPAHGNATPPPAYENAAPPPAPPLEDAVDDGAADIVIAWGRVPTPAPEEPVVVAPPINRQPANSDKQDLLAAIRLGTNLRKVDTAGVRQLAPPAPRPQANGEDLLAAMHGRLASVKKGAMGSSFMESSGMDMASSGMDMAASGMESSGIFGSAAPVKTNSSATTHVDVVKMPDNNGVFQNLAQQAALAERIKESNAKIAAMQKAMGLGDDWND